jgi:ribosomal protein S18 acetylase RimI-like enzyme
VPWRPDWSTRSGDLSVRDIAIQDRLQFIMPATWLPSEARREDAAAIAYLFLLSWTSPFTRLLFGDIHASTLSAWMTARIAKQIDTSSTTFIVIRDPSTQEIVSVAQWELPTDETTASHETQEELDERQNFEDELYRSTLPEDSNKDLMMEFTIGLRKLKHQVLQGEKHYLLGNLATHHDYRGRGFAEQVIGWVFPHADAENVPVYLETSSDNPAMRLYRRLGFEERGHDTIKDLGRFVSRQDLEKHGGITEHTHVAFVRFPAQTE